MDKPALARLAFWGMNMNAATGGRNNWPGFQYNDAEWARLVKLSDAVDGGPFARYVLICAVVFIALAAIAIVGLFVPIMTALYPNPADTKPLPFVLLLAATALLSLGVGLPISLRIAAWASAGKDMRERLAEEPGDAALAAKVSHQITRMVVIMCGILVPGTMLWIVFDIHGGPIITTLKWFGIMLMGASSVHTFLRRKPRAP